MTGQDPAGERRPVIDPKRLSDPVFTRAELRMYAFVLAVFVLAMLVAA